MDELTKPLDIPGIVKEITQRLNEMPSVSAAPVRTLSREYSRRLVSASPDEIMAIATGLLNQCDHFRRFVAYDLIQCHRPTFKSLRARNLKLLAKELDNWGAVDLFAGYLAGPCWRENQISDKLVHRWARSSDRWWRRAALVCTVPLNARSSGGEGDTPRTLQVCQMLIKDRDDMVVKAMSWALRALSKRDPKSVRQFITENQSDLTARVVREVRNKLETGLKDPRKRTVQ